MPCASHTSMHLLMLGLLPRMLYAPGQLFTESSQSTRVQFTCLKSIISFLHCTCLLWLILSNALDYSIYVYVYFIYFNLNLRTIFFSFLSFFFFLFFYLNSLHLAQCLLSWWVFSRLKCTLRDFPLLSIKWLRLCAPNAGDQVQSQVRELDPTGHN